MEKLTPQQHTGRAIDAISSREFLDGSPAGHFFEILKHRLEDVNSWQAMAGHFQNSVAKPYRWPYVGFMNLLSFEKKLVSDLEKDKLNGSISAQLSKTILLWSKHWDIRILDRKRAT